MSGVCNVLQAGCPFELNPYTLDTHPGPETLNGFLQSGIAPSTTGAEVLDRAIGLGKACTAHPHVVHGEGMLDRLAIFSWQRYAHAHCCMLQDLGMYAPFAAVASNVYECHCTCS